MTNGIGSPAPAITSDNFHLSQGIQARPEPLSEAVSNPLSALGCTDPKILEFVAAATAENTQRAYQSDLRHFLASGGLLPATPEQVARYLADHAATLSMATLARRVVGIRAAHVARGFADPTDSELVRLTFRGIRRTFGQPQRRVAALTIDQLANIIGSLGGSSKDIRDAAILLIGFAGAFRRSALVAIDRGDVQIHETGAAIILRRSKTDQLGVGRTVSIPRVQGRLCPVTALQKCVHLGNRRWAAVQARDERRKGSPTENLRRRRCGNHQNTHSGGWLRSYPLFGAFAPGRLCNRSCTTRYGKMADQSSDRSPV
jgi:integrase